MPIIGKKEIYLVVIIVVLIVLELVHKPFCLVCVFQPRVTQFLSLPKSSLVQGIISSEPKIGYTSQRFILSLRKHNILLVVNRYQQFSYGDVVQVTGAVGKPDNFGSFDYQAYLLHEGVAGVAYFPQTTIIGHNQGSPLLAWLYGIKASLRKPILTNLPEPHASFLLSMTLGDDWRVPPDFRQALVNSGTIHIISISGLHMTFISLAVFFLFIVAGLNRPLATVATGISLLGYIIMTGTSSAAIRSGLMGTLLLVGYLLGRAQKLLYALLLSGALMIVWDSRVIYDIGFQLSFGAMLGLVVFTGQFRVWFYAIINIKPNKFLDIIPASLAANLGVFPILAWHFGRVSLLAPLANLVILPVIPALMALGFLAELTGLFMWPLWLLLEYSVRVISLIGLL